MSGTNFDEPLLESTTNRIEALTDGIFAIAMTLLVFNLHLSAPKSTGPVNSDLLGLLVGHSHIFVNFIISFLLLAVFWVIHHQQSRFIKRTDRKHIWLNVFMLMFVCLMPFSVSLIGDYHHDRIANLFFGLNIFILGMLFYWNWHYATQNHRLISPNMDPERIALGKRRTAVTPVVSLLAVFLALVHPHLSTYTYLLIPIILSHPYLRPSSE